MIHKCARGEWGRFHASSSPEPCRLAKHSDACSTRRTRQPLSTTAAGLVNGSRQRPSVSLTMLDNCRRFSLGNSCRYRQWLSITLVSLTNGCRCLLSISSIALDNGRWSRKRLLTTPGGLVKDRRSFQNSRYKPSVGLGLVDGSR